MVVGGKRKVERPVKIKDFIKTNDYVHLSARGENAQD